MRFSLLVLTFLILFSGSYSWAQPSNDDCAGAIDLGQAPVCQEAIYSNTGATASNVGAPACFNGGNADRDVWFSFQTSAELNDVTIFLNGRPDGAGQQPLLNPQIALYRGTCGGLSQLACAAATEGAGQVRLDMQGLSPNSTYLLRVSDFSATAASNAGDFTLCIRKFEPDYNMGQAAGSTACFGRLFDSGGPDGNYRPGELRTFTICPDQPNACLLVDMVDFQFEGDDNGFSSDYLNVYEGEDVSGRLIASVFGVSDGTPFRIESPGGCVTVEFAARSFASREGFELVWECSALPCGGSSAQNPTIIDEIPFRANRLSTCTGKATVADSPCSGDLFLSGPDYVFAYNSPGDVCAKIQVSNARPGIGVVVMDGPPGDPGSGCVALGAGGSIESVNMQTPGTYYIIVSKDQGCTDFSISVEEADCGISPALADALRNPLNGCVRDDGFPSVFMFQDGFQDMDIQRGVNSGCWLNVGNQADFYWFTVQAQTPGMLGFILESADIPSDIDFNVWGPFPQKQVVEDPESIIAFIQNNQPIRSTWAPVAGPTGMVVNHPVKGFPVNDVYDCAMDEPGATGDDYIRIIDAEPGEVYVILVNDWGDQISTGGISVDWSPTTLGLLEPAETEVIRGDTAICSGSSAQIVLDIGTNTIEWISGTETLSCTDCPDPVATPAVTTVYTAVVESVCYNDTIDVKVSVFDVDAGRDQTVCPGEEIQIVAGEDFEDATYRWTSQPSAGVEFSCTDCADPLIRAVTPGTYQIRVRLTADGCTLNDAMTLTVQTGTAPDYTIDDREFSICQGESVNIGVDNFTGNLNFLWTSEPQGTVSQEDRITVSPDVTTKYLVEINGETCNVPSFDSVIVVVNTNPVIDVRSDTLICVGDTVQLGFGPKERNTVYTWVGPPDLLDEDTPQAKAIPQNSGNYTLTATRGNCTVSDDVDIEVNIADVNLVQDTLFLCLGATETLEAIIRNPAGEDLVPTWTSTDPNFPVEGVVAKQIEISPTDSTIYRVELSYEQCVQTDSILVVVDSLPELMIEPADTMICQGQYVIFRTPAYETSEYPDIEFAWLPFAGQQSPDSLLNMVVTPDTTTLYYRITTNNACRDSTAANVVVKPIEQISIIPADTLLCFGESIQYSVMTPKPLENIMWQPEQGLSCPGSAELDCDDPIATAVSTIDYNLTAEIDGCPVSASARLEVFPTPQINFPNRTIICEGESVQLNNIATPGATYVWTSTDPDFGMVTDPTPVVTPKVTTTYFVNASIDDPEITCEPRMDEITIEVVGDVDVQIAADPDEVCAGEPVLLQAIVTGGTVADQFLWTSSDGQSFQGQEVTVNPFSTTTYFLTFISGGGCETINRTAVVTVLPGVSVTIQTDAPPEVPEGSEIILNANILTNSPGPLDILWTENGASFPGGTEVTVKPGSDDTEYVVTVTTPDGCSDSDAVSFDVVEPEFQVPNAFTPNGDGSNDRFRPLSTGDIDRIVTFQIFNRWGQIVYDNQNGTDGWDGEFNGNPQPSDLYAYIIVIRTLGGNERTFRGEVTLIR